MARDSYLTPLRRQEHVPVVQVDMRSAVQIRDFNQTAVTHEDLAGGYIPDFYGAYLDQRMQTARKALRT